VVGDGTLVRNIGLMIMVWVSSSFTFYLLNFMIKYMPGDIYFNSIVSGLSAAAMLTQGLISPKLGAKGSMIFSFTLTTLASLVLCFFGEGTTHAVLYALVLCLAKSGATLNFGFAYAIHHELFPNFFIITSYGVCNFVCRGLTIFAPIVAEMPDHVVPFIFCVGGSLLGLLSASLLKKKTPEGGEGGLKLAK
jgi:hypothetical protein